MLVAEVDGSGTAVDGEDEDDAPGTESITPLDPDGLEVPLRFDSVRPAVTISK